MTDQWGPAVPAVRRALTAWLVTPLRSKAKEVFMTVPISGPIDLSQRKAIVTGAARGIGRAVCCALAREGADVACLDVLDTSETAGMVTGRERNSLALQCDVCDAEQIRTAIGRAKSDWGRIDILVASHGILGRSREALPELTIEEWDRIQTVNLRGAFLVTQAVWPWMEEQRNGKIVLMGSVAGKVGGVLAGPHYCASKGGIHAFVKWAAKSGASLNILVNGIAPGPVVTPMTAEEPYRDDMLPLGRLGQPEDIAEAAVFLVSQASNFITGCVLDVNGGILMA